MTEKELREFAMRIFLILMQRVEWPPNEIARRAWTCARAFHDEDTVK